MAGVLQRFEQRLEEAVSGAFARAFRSAVQPVEIAAALQREVDNSAHIMSRDRTLVPNDFVVELSPVDYGRLATFAGTLSAELSTLVQDHVNDQRYTLPGPISINFKEAAELSTGRFRVRSSTNASVTPVAGQRMTDTAIRRAEAVLEVNGMRHPLISPAIVLGRGAEADLRINDPGISRRHAEIRTRSVNGLPQVSVVDLNSTNGILVDGRRVQDATLRDGSTIVMGKTTMTIRITTPEA
ncbi:MAG: hypothetical protein JWP10_533 [Nocardioidaceae bacterium]|nr:hypothetical protein [Nocardioidaceae bacterium]